MYCFRLRNSADLDGLVEELAAVHPKGKKGILELYRRPTSEQFGFLYCDLMQRDPDLMFKDQHFRPLTDKKSDDENGAEEISDDRGGAPRSTGGSSAPVRQVPGQSR